MCLLEKKLKLYGFNNLTKTLSFNIYDVCYAKGAREQKEYIDYIDEQYNSERLTGILCDVTDIIGANVLNISKQDTADKRKGYGQYGDRQVVQQRNGGRKAAPSSA